MLRIAHISDLHFIHSDVDKETESSMSWLSNTAEKIGRLAGPDVVADGHNEYKLSALENIFGELRPNVIVVTGDITNFGDRKSFELAVESLERLKKVAEAKHLICIPGNHDCLAERVASLRQKGWKARAVIKALSLFNKPLAKARELSFDPEIKAALEQGEGLPLLKNYQDVFASKYPQIKVDPSEPFFVEAGWGEVAFFLFNSTNDPGYMANEGSIGPRQYNALNQCWSNAKTKERVEAAVRIALLHHHPLNNPNIDEKKIERGYDAMIDGTRFLENLISPRGFHFILHGHQHREYMWEFFPGLRPHISAAGSALAGSNSDSGSFNIIDLITPFRAVYHCYGYSSTGFKERVADERKLKVHSLASIRVSGHNEPLTGEDIALQNFVAGRSEGTCSNHEYELLDYDVTISSDQLYSARYRRKGKVVGPKRSYGLNFVITGNPPMQVEDMDVKAIDNNNSADPELKWTCLVNSDTQKIFHVMHVMPLDAGQEFDITFEFKWQASEAYPNDTDGMNLLYFTRQVKQLSYLARVPWKPAQFDVTGHAVSASKPELKDWKVEQKGGGNYECSFTIDSPKPLAYLITLGPHSSQPGAGK
jgi:3',5'-cyclic AMP phosphodiesterase CpdA